MRAERTLSVELRPPARGFLDELDRLNPRAVEREELLDAHAIALTRDSEVASDILLAVIDGENLALEVLNTEFVAFLDLYRDTNDIASTKLGEVLLRGLGRLLGVDLIQ